jgi:hypothetical protein
MRSNTPHAQRSVSKGKAALDQFNSDVRAGMYNRSAPAPTELNAWLGLIQNGDANGTHYTHDMVLVGFAESPENIAKTAADWLIQI